MKNNKKALPSLLLLFITLLLSGQASATWLLTHGNSGHLEDEAATSTFYRRADGLEVKPDLEPSTWVHFTVPTDGSTNTGARFIKLLFTVGNQTIDSQISRIDIYNGNLLVKSFTGLNLKTLGYNTQILDLGGIKRFSRGMGVSVEITTNSFDSGADSYTFHGVGANFVPIP